MYKTGLIVCLRILIGGDEVGYHFRLLVLLFVDSVLIILSIILSKTLLLNVYSSLFSQVLIVTAFTLLFSYYILVFIYKLYKKILEYASIGEMIIILKVVTLSIIFAAIIQQVVFQTIHFRLLIITWMLQMLFIGGSRFWWRVFRDTYINKCDNKKNTLIIGAAAAGTMIVRQLRNNKDSELQPVAFIDDDKLKHNLEILGVPVAGSLMELEEIVIKHKIEHIIIAIPSLSKKQLNAIFLECAKTKAKTQILPMLEDIITGKVSINEFR